MSRTRYTFFNDDPAPYFVTATTVNWLPLFSNPEVASILIESLRYLISSQRIVLYANMIMENHLHLIAGSKTSRRKSPTLNHSLPGRVLTTTRSAITSLFSISLRFINSSTKPTVPTSSGKRDRIRSVSKMTR